ncbi:MAG: thioesterase II family protein [Acidobacteria bacterium]|nr:thioesterase II family protein [Acidobacteriota bacterium]
MDNSHRLYTSGRAATASSSPWLPQLNLNPRATLRLFCFPYAGGGAVIFRDWQSKLPGNVEVCPVQLPGRGKRLGEQPFTQMQFLAEALVHALLPHLDKPFAFFGHSMGALISFELARTLRKKYGRAPRQLFVSGRRAPSIPNLEPPTYDLPETEFIETLHNLKGTPGEVLEHPELMKLVLPLLRADFALCETYGYTPAPPLDCPISAFGGLQDAEVTRAHLEGWRTETTATFSLRMFPGDHFFLNTGGALLLRVLSQALYEVSGAVGQEPPARKGMEV